MDTAYRVWIQFPDKDGSSFWSCVATTFEAPEAEHACKRATEQGIGVGRVKMPVPVARVTHKGKSCYEVTNPCAVGEFAALCARTRAIRKAPHEVIAAAWARKELEA